VELEPYDTEPPRGTPPVRRFRTRIVLTALAVVVAVAIAAGIALTRSHPASVGAGVVVIDTNLGYQNGRAAGTGMVLTSSGLVLTNNHVIRGATAIRVVVPGTGKSFTAHVVGYDVSDDVAVLQAGHASNLKTIPVGDSDSVTAGQSVKALGNAGGTGALRPASGTVTGVDRGITVSDDQGGSESLAGMIETNAPIQPGDSGGPLLNADGQVVGMDTAANIGNGSEQTASAGFAIPINKATSIAQQITHGDASHQFGRNATREAAVTRINTDQGSLGTQSILGWRGSPGTPARPAMTMRAPASASFRTQALPRSQFFWSSLSQVGRQL